MSYQIGIDTIHLRPTPRLAHTEYCSNAALMRHVTGDPSAGAHGRFYDPSAGKVRFEDLWAYDFIWSINDGPIDWAAAGRITDMGHAEFLEGGVDMRQPVECPFKDVEEVLAFDAVEEYGLPDFDELVDFYEQHWQKGQKESFPNQVFTGGYYKTIVSGAIQSFGWDMLLEAAADRERFAKVLDSFYRRTLFHMQAWAKTSCEVVIQHDDFVWSQGPFMHPDIYRETIIPRYAELWKVLREAGKKVLFCSDANFDIFVDDIFNAGAHGIIFEPMMDIDTIVEKYGKTHVIVGSKVDARTMAFHGKDEIRKEIDDTLAIAKDCPGFMFAIGNHLPSNVPVENALFYFEYLSEHWDRGA